MFSPVLTEQRNLTGTVEDSTVINFFKPGFHACVSFNFLQSIIL